MKAFKHAHKSGGNFYQSLDIVLKLKPVALRLKKEASARLIKLTETQKSQLNSILGELDEILQKSHQSFKLIGIPKYLLPDAEGSSITGMDEDDDFEEEDDSDAQATPAEDTIEVDQVLDEKSIQEIIEQFWRPESLGRLKKHYQRIYTALGSAN